MHHGVGQWFGGSGGVGGGRGDLGAALGFVGDVEHEAGDGEGVGVDVPVVHALRPHEGRQQPRIRVGGPAVRR